MVRTFQFLIPVSSSSLANWRLQCLRETYAFLESVLPLAQLFVMVYIVCTHTHTNLTNVKIIQLNNEHCDLDNKNLLILHSSRLEWKKNRVSLIKIS